MLFKNMKAMVISPDGDTEFFDMVTDVLQEDQLSHVYNQPKLCASTVDRSN